MTRSLVLLSIAPFLILPLGGCMAFRANVSRVDLVNYPAPTSSVRVRSNNGAISVSGGDVDDIQVEAKITAYGRTEDEAQTVLDESEVEFIEDGGVLTVQLASVSPKNASASFKIVMPTNLACDLKTSNGAVVARQLTSSVAVKTSNGAVSIGNVGQSIKVKTSNGAIAVNSETPATVQLKTSNGAVKYAGTLVGQDNRFTSSNGRIEMDLQGGATMVTASTGNGSIKLDGTKLKKGNTVLVGSTDAADDEPAAVSVETSNGSIQIRDKTAAIIGEAA